MPSPHDSASLTSVDNLIERVSPSGGRSAGAPPSSVGLIGPLCSRGAPKAAAAAAAAAAVLVAAAWTLAAPAAAAAAVATIPIVASGASGAMGAGDGSKTGGKSVTLP